MSTIKAISANPVKNNGGSAAFISDADSLNGVIVSTEIQHFGSIVVDNEDVDPAISGNQFAHNNTNPIQSYYGDFINDPSLIKSVNGIEAFDSPGTATAIRAGYWNMYSGKWTVEPTSTYDLMHSALGENTDFIDRILTQSINNRGSITYMVGGRQVVQGLKPDVNDGPIDPYGNISYNWTTY